MVPWKVLATVSTSEGPLQLRQRGAREFLIMIGGRVLMTSTERTSEKALATLAIEQLAGRDAPRVLIGGLGMAYTVRAALDVLPPRAQVTVAELTPEVVAWCAGPLAPLTGAATADPRVRVVVEDVSRVIEQAPRGHFDAIILDLYEGPHADRRRENDRLYGRAALQRTFAALSTGGVLSIWSEATNAAFKRRMIDVGFDTTLHHPGGPKAYVVYLGRAVPPAPRRPAPPPGQRPGLRPWRPPRRRS